VQRGPVVITKSTHRDRIEENSSVFDFTLPDRDMAELDALDQTDGTDRALESKWWLVDRTSASFNDFHPAGSQPGHNLPESAGSSGLPKDSSLVDFVFARTTRESVGHLRTRPRHGSGP
jgi:hypothetical protein